MCAFGECPNFPTVWESHINVDNPRNVGNQKHYQNDDEQTKHASEDIKSSVFDIEILLALFMQFCFIVQNVFKLESYLAYARGSEFYISLRNKSLMEII